MSTHESDSEPKPAIGAGYAVFQLAKALAAQDRSPEASTNPQAQERIARWEQVVRHALLGTAAYGSRTPFADVPVWATPEVATGGFATGRLLAGGDLTESERDLAGSTPGIRVGFERLDLNAWHLTDEGLGSLQRRLSEGNYRIDVPEEAALPTIAWLVGQGRLDEARALIETIAPYFDRLRFFPSPSKGLPASAVVVEVFRAGEVAKRLSAVPAQKRLATQKKSIESRLPLYDAAVELFLATVEDSWPCRSYPDGWGQRAASLVAQFGSSFGSVAPAKDRVGELFSLLAIASRNPAALTGRQVGRIRRIVTDFVAKYGAPDSSSHHEYRSRQKAQVAGPTHDLIGKVVSKRLEACPADQGISDFAELSRVLTAEEASQFSLAEGTEIPDAIRRRLERCRRGTIAELIDAGLITSGDTMAKLLPAMTAEIRSAGLRDAVLRNLYAATYRAFRRRRSLLLLNLESQVGLGELPWVAVIERERRPDANSAHAAAQALVETAALTLAAFPQAIVPNKLLQEFRVLAKTAELNLPFIDEVAADIFMGEFSNKFIDNARRAARVIAGTPYARYYAIDTIELERLPDRSEPGKVQSWWRKEAPVADSLAQLCAQRAGAQLGTWRPATNGTVIEQQQILTTHNLALLFGDAGLKAFLYPHLAAMAKSCFDWICMRQQMRIDDYHARLIMTKSTAYAWRQLVFYLSMLSPLDLNAAFASIEQKFESLPNEFKVRFAPVVIGLREAIGGLVLPQHEFTIGGGRVFLGWTTGSHWLIQAQKSVTANARSTA